MCEIGTHVPVGERPSTEAPRFQVLDDFRHPNVERYQRFLAANGIEIAGIEFIVDAAGEAYTYDVNTNTNYNSAAEARAGRYGMRAIASFLGRELKALYNPPLSIAKHR